MDQFTNFPPQQPIPDTMPMEVTLEAREWNIVQAALQELPMKFVRTLSDKLAQQLFMQARKLERAAPKQEE